MAGDRIESISWRDLPESYGHHTTNRFVRFRKAGNLGTDFELVRRVRTKNRGMSGEVPRQTLWGFEQTWADAVDRRG
jgi:hypothetical protein